MQVFYYLVIAFYGLIGLNDAHDIHVSVTDIDISNDGEIEIVVKVFLDDLMLSMGLELGAELPKDYTSSNDLINKFLADNFSIKINDKEIAYQLDDTTPSSPAVWITLIGHAGDDEIKNIEINNRILIEQFEDQSNMVKLHYQGERYSDLLDGDNTQYLVAVAK